MREGEKYAESVRAAMRAMITSGSHGVIDYVSVARGDTLEELTVIEPPLPVMISLAVRFGPTRLIDNISLTL